ncbi:MAG: hypothetical protein M0Q38_17295 [Bacteroidales bacterium]|jgi:uncharacterized protein (TIGR02145 family)|nr:hypothetical protein [Bacteroidales bacterium]
MKKFLLIFPIIISSLYANAQVFDCGTSILTDTDGYQYHTVLMGSRCWTKENMRTTHYANGQPVGIPKSKSGFRESINMPGKLQVNLNLLKAENINIDIYNAEGKKIYYSDLWCSSGSNIMDFIIGPPGFYLVNLNSETVRSTFKVIGGDQSIIEVKSLPTASGYKSEPIVLDPNPRFYYDYDNDPANDEKFGKLYTPASALNVEYDWTVTLDTVIQGICPNGWHVSNDADWMQLELYKGMTPSEIQIMFLNDRGTIANTLKTSDTAYWFTDYGTGDLEFSARGAGFYRPDGGFFVLKDQTDWITYSPHWGPMIRNITSVSVSVIRSTILTYEMGYAYSVRCVKDY